MNIIAEIGTSHNTDINKAFSLIDAAKDCGSDTVKFQWVYADEILHPNTGFVSLPTGKISLYNRFKELECSKDFYEKCRNYAYKKNIKFACSPFGKKSLQELVELSPDYIKIASPELNYVQLLEMLSPLYKKIPIIISSGVSKLKDIELAVETILNDNSAEKNEYLTLLHCSTSYPTPEEDYNVSLVQTLRNTFGINTGISDHSLNPVLVPVLATAYGATVIEKHITLSNETDGLDDPVALNPENFSLMVYEVHQTLALIERWKKEILSTKNLEAGFLDEVPLNARKEIFKQMINQFGEEKVTKCSGDGIKKLSESEKENYGRTNRSLHYLRDIKKGEKVLERDIGILRTEKELSVGIEPVFLEKIKNRILTKDVFSGCGVQFEDFVN